MMIGDLMPCMARLEMPGSLYYITAHAVEGRNLFVDDEDRRDFLYRFEKGLKQCDSICYVWALMGHQYTFLQLRTLG